MTKKITVLLILFIGLSTQSYGQIQARNTIIDFPDSNFECALLSNRLTVDTSGDGKISVLEAKNATDIRLGCAAGSITNLAGIEHFTNLKVFSAWGNSIISADFSNNPQLEFINLRDNYSLTSIILDNNTSLKTLYLSNNQLTTIDVSNNTELTYLELNNNNLTDIDLSNNNLIHTLYLHYNLIASLDVRNCSLKKLQLNHNPNLEWALLTNQPFTTSIEGQPEYLSFENVRLDYAPNLKFICVDPIYLTEAEDKKLEPNHSNYAISANCSDLPTNSFDNYFTIAPNPVTYNTLGLTRIDENIRARTAAIYTLTGVPIKRVSLIFNDFSILSIPSTQGLYRAFINVSDVRAGQYILQVHTNLGDFSTNFIKL